MFKDKPVISNQHGALAMAFFPYLYAVLKNEINITIFLFGIAWFFLYLFSYPFLSLFSKKPTIKNKKWAFIYFMISLAFLSPVIFNQPTILLFLGGLLPLALVQIYYAKQRDERNLINDIAGVFTFGIIGLATAYLASGQIQWGIFIHPTIFFIAITIYIKSMVRERKNPFYLKLSIVVHLLLSGFYLGVGLYWIGSAYLIALLRAIIIPQKNYNVKQIGLLEFPVLVLFFISLNL